MDCDTLVMPALGRPFELGMLYDCRADKLVPGMTLWDHEKLEQDMTVTPKPNTETEIVASESISDKSSSLGVDASLKASLFSGLVSVDGSAKYLNDNKSSKNQARVTLQYKTTTEFKKLTMNQLGSRNIMHPYIFEKGIATHVVTAILYGAQAFFVFDRETSHTESIQDIQGNLQVVIKNIPQISIEGEGSLKMEDKDKEKIQNISCKFHGDFHLDQSPLTFEDAVKVYQDLPKLLGPNGEKAVPVQVWLLPLTTLDSSAAKLVRQISVRLVSEAQKVLEDFVALEMRCNDLLKSTAVKQFPQIAENIKTFMELCSESKLGLQRTLAQKLPAIRGGGEDEAELAEILKKRAASPFNSKSLNQWLDCKVKEGNTIISLTKIMKNTDVLYSYSDLTERTYKTQYVMCYVFTSLESSDPYLSALDDYLKDVQSDKPGLRAKDIEKEQWYFPKDVRDTMRSKATLFSDFAQANEDNNDIKFVTVGFTNDDYIGSSIYLYEDGFESSDNFDPPSKPEAVNVEDVKHDRVTLKLSPPKYGAEAITSYRVEYCVNGETEWHQLTEPNHGEVTVSGLSPTAEYSFRVRAVTNIGVGPAAQVNSSIKTLPEPEGPRRFTEEARKECTLIQNKGSLQVLKVLLVKDQLNILGCGRFFYGQDSMKKNRTLMVMGATGAGKSILINGMINYIFGVQWTDPYRFKLVVEDQAKSQAQSQTSEVTVYKINYQDGFAVDFSLTIIDTPGFGDTRGIERDREITEQIRTLFSSDFGVSDIHAVCFVAQSALARLSATQRYVFDSVLSIFGKDVAENIRILVTFADGQLPPVLEAIKVAQVPCPKTDDGLPAHYKFNNSALFAENQTSPGGFDEMFWNMGKASMRGFFDALDKIDPKSLTLTKEVLQERKQLEESVDDLEEKVKDSLSKLDEIRQTEEQIKMHEADIERNKEFEIEITVTRPVQEDISGTGNYITNCQICHHTCHYPCGIADDSAKAGCWAMGPDGNCTKCLGKCHWTKHYNQKYRWEYKEVTEKKTVEDLKEKFLKGTEEKQTVEGLVATLRKEYQNLKETLAKIVKIAAGFINRLKEIALKPNPLSAPDYVDLLIESERNQRHPGWKERVKSLKEVKQKAELLAKVDKGKALVDD